MTKDGKENRFGRFVFEDEQAERIAAGDMSAAWEFIEQNRRYLECWSRSFRFKFIWGVSFLYYDTDEFINQVFVDFPLYSLESEKSIAISIFRSWRNIGNGGYQYDRKSAEAYISLDEPARDASQSGENESGATIGELLASRGESSPYDLLERREHMKEIAPKMFAELGKVCGKNGAEAFRDVIEEVFFGLTFEEVERYAKR